MKLNVQKLKDDQKAKADAAKARRASWPKPEAVPGDVGPRPAGTSYRGQGYDDFGSLVAAGDFRRLIVRPVGEHGCEWTLKAVLVVREKLVYVYMHGVCESSEMTMPLIDRLLRKGDWHEDRYPAKGD